MLIIMLSQRCLKNPSNMTFAVSRKCSYWSGVGELV